jgi:hypothetical protein
MLSDERKRRKPRIDRRLTMAQAREIRYSILTGPEWVNLLWERDRISITTVAIWKIRHNLLYREAEPDGATAAAPADNAA